MKDLIKINDNIAIDDKDTMLCIGAFLNNVCIEHKELLSDKQINVLKIADNIITQLAFKLDK